MEQSLTTANGSRGEILGLSDGTYSIDVASEIKRLPMLISKS